MELLQYALFDLDGTLTDPALGITNCVMYALAKFDIFPVSREELYPYIGPPLLHSFTHYHGLTLEEAEEAVTYYRERFAVQGLYENTVFDGIPELLKELRDRGVTLIIATSKPEEFADRILKHFDLAKYFDFVAGSTLNGRRPEKGDVIAYIRQRFPEIHRHNTLMIGDRKYDVIGAHSQGLKAVGVLYGYGDREEMKMAEADFMIGDVPTLHDFLLREI